MDRIEKRLIFLYSLRKKKVDELLCEYGLKYEDYQIIRALRYVDGASVEDITEEVGRHLTSVQFILQHLIDKGYIERNANKIYLTEAIKKLYPQIRKIVKDADEEVISHLGYKELDQLINKLDKMIEYYE